MCIVYIFIVVPILKLDGSCSCFSVSINIYEYHACFFASLPDLFLFVDWNSMNFVWIYPYIYPYIYQHSVIIVADVGLIASVS